MSPSFAAERCGSERRRWSAIGIVVATVILIVIPGAIYGYYVLDLWTADTVSYATVVHAVEPTEEQSGPRWPQRPDHPFGSEMRVVKPSALAVLNRRRLCEIASRCKAVRPSCDPRVQIVLTRGDRADRRRQPTARARPHDQPQRLDVARSAGRSVRGLDLVEPIVEELPLEYAVETNRLIQIRIEGSVG